MLALKNRTIRLAASQPPYCYTQICISMTVYLSSKKNFFVEEIPDLCDSNRKPTSKIASHGKHDIFA